ncbi:MAG: FmdB family zinc ribbon protein [bacterium]
MPIYEYQCLDCGKRFEVFQKISEDPLKECKACNGRLNRLISLRFSLMRKRYLKYGKNGRMPVKSFLRPENSFRWCSAGWIRWDLKTMKCNSVLPGKCWISAAQLAG